MEMFDKLLIKSLDEAYEYAYKALLQADISSMEKIMWTINLAQIQLRKGEKDSAKANYLEARRLIDLEDD